MKKLRPHIFTFVAVGLTFFASAAHSAEQSKDLNEALKPCGLQVSGGLRLDSDFQRSSGDKVYDTIVASNDALYVEIEMVHPVSEQRASNYAKSQYTVLQSLYDAKRSPYPGQITSSEECPPSKKPESRTADILGRKADILLANGTDRHTFGVWQDDLIKTRGAFCVVYDPISQATLEFRVFQSSSAFKPETVIEFLKSLKRI